MRHVARGNPRKPGQTATFSYDANDNLLVKHHEGQSPLTFTYDSRNRITTTIQGSAVSTYTWAQRGLLSTVAAAGGVTTYMYEDIRNSLVNVQVPTGPNSTYTYNADGLRLRAREGSVTTTFVWDGSDYLAANRSGADDGLYTVLEGEVVGEDVGGTLRDFLTDPLGSVRGTFNASNVLQNPVSYWPYGEVATDSRGNADFQWLGSLGYFDDPGSRSYVRAREYDQVKASWLQIDPLWPEEPAWGYVGGRPVAAVDPSGLAVYLCKSGPHWGLVVTGDGCLGGARVDYSQGGLSVIWPGGGKGKDDCKTIPTSPSQEECLCRIIKTLDKMPGALLCGRPWLPGPTLELWEPTFGTSCIITNPLTGGDNYNLFTRNCQAFVNAAFKRCGLPRLGTTMDDMLRDIGSYPITPF